VRASERVRLGVVGLGRIGGLHADNLAGRVSSIELVRVVDIEPEIARAAGERLGVDWSTSYEDLLGDPSIDGVLVATPTPTHARLVEEAAAASKHVFCEKPVSFDLPSTTRALDAASAAGIVFQVGFQRRFDPDHAAAAARIAAGELGGIYLFPTALRGMRP